MVIDEKIEKRLGNVDNVRAIKEVVKMLFKFLINAKRIALVLEDFL